MNIIAGFLKNLSPLPSPTNIDPRDGSESSIHTPAGKGNGFESVLSGFAQNDQTASKATNVTLQPRPSVRTANGEDGSGGQAQDEGGNANPDPNAAASPIIVKNALSANASASPLSLLSLTLFGGEESAAQGAALDQQTQTNANALKSNVAPQPFSAQQKASASSQLSGTSSGAPAPDDEQPALAQPSTATTQGAASIGASAGSNNGLAILSAKGMPPATSGGKPQFTLVPNDNSNGGSDPSVAATNSNGPSSSFVGNAQKQADRPNAQPTRDADQSASAPNIQPQPVSAPNIAAMAANAGLTAGVVMAAVSQTPASQSSTAQGQAGARGATTERAGASPRPQRPADQSATTDNSGGLNLAVDPVATAIPDPQAATVGLDPGAGAGHQSPDSFAPQTAPLPLSQMSNPVFAPASASDSLAPLDSDAVPDIKVSVLSTQTHFAPPQRLSPVQQIIDAVSVALPPSSANLGAGLPADAANQSAAAGSASAASSGNLDTSGQATGPVKVLNLQLEPPSLGGVTISLNLSSGGLSVALAASQASTASLIERDKNSLSDQLRDSGYSIAGVAVTLDTHQTAAIANDGSAAQGQAGQNLSQNNGQAMSSDGGSSNANGNGQNGGNRSLSQPTGGTPDSFTSAGGGGASSGDLYI